MKNSIKVVILVSIICFITPLWPEDSNGVNILSIPCSHWPMTVLVGDILNFKVFAQSFEQVVWFSKFKNLSILKLCDVDQINVNSDVNQTNVHSMFWMLFLFKIIKISGGLLKAFQLHQAPHTIFLITCRDVMKNIPYLYCKCEQITNYLSPLLQYYTMLGSKDWRKELTRI